MTTQKNGNPVAAVATKGNGKPVETTLPVVPTKKEEQKKEETESGIAPLDDRLHRLSQLFELQSKYNRLLKSKQKVAEFKMKKGEENISFTISDENSREEFSTSNPDIIREVLEFVSIKIEQKRKEIEPLLVW